MTPEQLREAARVMLAAADGKAIEVCMGKSWVEIPEPEFAWGQCRYRIKPEPLRIPVRLYKHCTTSEIQPFNLLTPIPMGFEPVSSAVDIEVKE